MPKLYHTWKKVSKFESVCTRCDCSRQKEGVKYGNNWRSVFYYMRSGMAYGLNMPECVDFTDNTLD